MKENRSTKELLLFLIESARILQSHQKDSKKGRLIKKLYEGRITTYKILYLSLKNGNRI